jgi:hypothetical protein
MEPIEELTSKIAAEPVTRRGFFATLGKIAASAAAVVAGISLTNGGIANAAGYCCQGTACSGSRCPSGCSVQYTWVCCDGVCNQAVTCYDCYCGGHYNCTYTSGPYYKQGCPCF